VSSCISAGTDSVGEDCCCIDDILAGGIVEDCMAPGGDAGIDEDEEEEEDARTMRCSKDSRKAAVQVSSRRKRAASKSRLHVSTFAIGDSDTRILLLSSFATGAGEDDDAVCNVAVPTLVAVTPSIHAHICTGVAMMLLRAFVFVPGLP
jgi:hypothetical protein